MIRNIFYFFKSIIININFKKIRVSLSSRIHNKDTFEKYNKVGSKTYIKGRVGAYTYIGFNSNIVGNVGRFCSIGNNVKCVPASHPLNLVSTSPCFYSKLKQNNISFYRGNEKYIDEKEVVIGNDVWIGDNVLIKGGVHIGDGAVIGMGSVVTKDVAPYCVVGGCPAKVIKKRFDDKTIKFLLDKQWWNNDEKFFLKNSEYFLKVEDFIK